METIIKTYLLALYVFLAPVGLAFILVTLIIILDTVIGMWSKYHYAKINDLPNPITSKKFGFILLKLIVYGISLLTGFLIDTFMLDAILMLSVPINYLITKLIILIVFTRELMSIDEHIKILNRGKGIVFYFERLFGGLKWAIDKMKALLGKDEMEEHNKRFHQEKKMKKGGEQ